MKYAIIAVTLLLTSCNASVSYKTPAGGEASVSWSFAVPVVDVGK